MTADNQQPLAFAPDEPVVPAPRRAFLRRSLLGLTAIGLAPLLAACGGDDDESDDENTSDSPSGLESDNAAATIPDENQQVGEDDEADD